MEAGSGSVSCFTFKRFIFRDDSSVLCVAVFFIWRASTFYLFTNWRKSVLRRPSLFSPAQRYPQKYLPPYVNWLGSLSPSPASPLPLPYYLAASHSDEHVRNKWNKRCAVLSTCHNQYGGPSKTRYWRNKPGKCGIVYSKRTSVIWIVPLWRAMLSQCPLGNSSQESWFEFFQRKEHFISRENKASLFQRRKVRDVPLLVKPSLCCPAALARHSPGNCNRC